VIGGAKVSIFAQTDAIEQEKNWLKETGLSLKEFSPSVGIAYLCARNDNQSHRKMKKNMKKNLALAMLLTCACIMQCCSGDDPTYEYFSGYNGGGNGGSFISDITLTTFDVSIDKETAEPTTTATPYMPDEEDSFEAASFTNVVTVSFNDNTATCSTTDGVTISTDSAHVVADHGDTKGVCYVVSGTTANGSLTILGNKKYEVLLSGANIVNPDSTALNMLSKKRAFLVLDNGKNNSLADGPTSKDTNQKAALYCKGKLLVNGTGTLEVTGCYNNAIHSADYIVFQKGTNVYAKSTAGHGIKANDGIFINGGVINVEVTAAASKGLNSESDIIVNGGRTTVITTGDAIYDTDDQEAKGCAALKCDSVFTINGGELLLKSTGIGGKGIRAGWEAYLNGGTIAIVTTGGRYTYGNDDVTAKGIKVGTISVHGVLTVSGGNTMVRTSGSSAEGIESKGTLTISGNEAMVAVASTDDAINSAGDFTISGGNVLGYSTGNDGLDANGNFYIKGGTVYAIGASQPEVAIDANTEGGYKLYVTGGTIIAIGGLENNSSLSQACYSTTWNSNTWYALNGTGSLAFLTPNSGGSTMVVSTPTSPALTQGVTLTGGNTILGGMAVSGATTTGGSQASLASYTGGNGGPGGGPGRGPGGRW
jgi:hypothetical protein